MAKTRITEKEKLELEKELSILINEKRSEASKNVAIAREFGDLSENSEYDEARNEQAKIEQRIHDIEVQLKNSEIVTDADDTGVVRIGLTVEVEDIEYKEVLKYKLVGTTTIVKEADIDDSEIILISDQCPIGSKLIGAKKGDKISVEVPDGKVEYKILNITK